MVSTEGDTVTATVVLLTKGPESSYNQTSLIPPPPPIYSTLSSLDVHRAHFNVRQPNIYRPVVNSICLFSDYLLPLLDD